MKRFFIVMIQLGLLVSPIVLVSCTPTDNGGAPADKGSTAAVHMNQVAFESTGSKKAVVTAGQTSELANLSVIAGDGVEAFEADFEYVAGFEEWGGGKRHYLADFSGLRENGTFYLEARFEDGSKTRSGAFMVAENALFDTTVADVLSYFVANRNTSERDRAIPIIDTGELVDVYGGWNDAGGETGKYLSHLTYSNFFAPQQVSFVAWSMFASLGAAPLGFERLGLSDGMVEEAFWGADFLHRMLSADGSFYMTVFDRWGSDEDRWITGYKGLDGVYTPNYRAAFREGAGLAIAALARAARLSAATGRSGEFTGDQYLSDAKRAFAHLLENNESYCDDGKENIIDDYTALLAAVELYRSTGESVYIDHARARASALGNRWSSQGYLLADGVKRPYFHAVEAGLPVVSLLHYLEVEPDSIRRGSALAAVREILEAQLQLDRDVPNPFQYPRQVFQTFDFENQVYTSEAMVGFFVPHANETGYWWQGENSRLASLSAAATMAVEHFSVSEDPLERELAGKLMVFAQDTLDWILGKNPYDLCMLYGHGHKNPGFQKSGGAMVEGGISNGITGKMESPEGRGIDWLADDENGNWRWVEQWTPHGAWYLYAVSLMEQ